MVNHLSLSLFVACNVVSQTPEGSFTMVIPQQHRNCSFSIIYPVEIQIGELSLGQHNDLKVSIQIHLISGQESQHLHTICLYDEFETSALSMQRSILGCAGSGDFVELLGGNGMDTSKMFPMADLCYSFNGPGENSLFISCASSHLHLERKESYKPAHISLPLSSNEGRL